MLVVHGVGSIHEAGFKTLVNCGKDGNNWGRGGGRNSGRNNLGACKQKLRFGC